VDFYKWLNPTGSRLVSLSVHAKNAKNQIKSFHDHLFKRGSMPNYFVWTKHGERGVIMEDDEEEDGTILDCSQGGAFAEPIEDD
jgi:hypothetical protein